jgi:glycosyltransferase involved in cell wall biosynthesis
MTNISPLLSVIVPVYKVEPYLEQCVSSILTQTYGNLEIILVDDGSPDACPAICDRFADRDARVVCIHRENGGLVAARKTGLRRATGGYAAYVDGDDWIEPDLYEKLMDIALRDGADAVCADLIRETDEAPYSVVNTVAPGCYRTQSDLEFIYGMMLDRGNYGHFGILPFLHTKLFRREILSPAQNAVDERIVVGEDVACVYPCLLRAKVITVSDICGYHYRSREDSLSAESAATGDAAYLKMLILRDYLEEQFSVSEFRELLIPQNRRYFIWGLLMKFPQKAVNEKTGAVLVYDNLYRSERVAVYGAGGFGADIALGFGKSGVCELVVWVDRDYSNPWKTQHGVRPVELLLDYRYDKVVLASVHEDLLAEMTRTLIDMGIGQEKTARPRLDIIHGGTAIEVTE